MVKTSTSIKFGILTGVLLIMYFSLLGALGWNKSPLFSLINPVICAFGIYLAISEISSEDDFDKKTALKTGLVTGIIATAVFTIFFGIFASQSSGTITEIIEQMSFLGNSLFLLTALVFILGIISVYVVTYLLLAMNKKTWGLN